jgi:deoxyadenosine/deoxycytidine kinase
VAVVGNVAAGKTALVQQLLATDLFAAGLEEHLERPFQAGLRTDPRLALANQVDYLLLRAEQERSLRLGPRTGLQDGGLDLDFHLFTRLFHHKGYLTGEEYGLCARLYAQLRMALPPPDLFIRLTAPLTVVRRRFTTRTRSLEIATLEDIPLIETYLDEWLDGLPPQQLLLVDASADDPDFHASLPVVLARIQSLPVPV